MTHQDTPTPDSPSTATSSTTGRVPRRWRRLGLLSGTMVVDNDETQVLTTLYPVIQKVLALPVSGLGTFTAVSKIVGVVTGPLAALLARRTDRKMVIVVLTLLGGLGTAAAGFSANFTHLLIFYSFVAACTAGVVPIVHELLADLFDDATRSRASAILYGVIHLGLAVIGPLVGQFSRVPDGWRYGFFASGAATVLFGLAVLLFFRDPGLGASEARLAGTGRQGQKAYEQITWARIRELLKVRTFVLMLVQRLLSGNLLLPIFGVTLLVNVYGFSTATAAVVNLPYGIGYIIGSFTCGPTADFVNRRLPKSGRIVMMQLLQLVYAGVAFFATQVDWGSIVVFAALFAGLGFVVGFNPGLNRPIVMAVSPPELRGVAFAVMLSIVQAIAWAILSFGAGFLADVIGLKATLLWGLVVLMVVNGAFITLLYRPYARDSRNLQVELDRRATSQQ